MEKQIITSRHNELITKTMLLKDKKYRDESGLFMFEGVKLLRDSLRVKCIYTHVFVTENAYNKHTDLFENKSLSDAVIFVSEDVYSKMTLEKSPEGILTVCEIPGTDIKKALSAKRIMILDSVSDPGNVGTIVRSADAFSVDAVILGKGCADIYNPKTVRACMGSLFRVKVFTEVDLPEFIGNLKKDGFRVYAAMLDKNSKKLQDIDFAAKSAFVIGNEGSGVSDEVRKASGESVYIPMSDGPESLNAAMSATIIMWEMFSKNF